MPAGSLSPDRSSGGLVEFSRAAAEARSAPEILEVLVATAVERGLADAAAVFQVGADERATIAAARNLPRALEDVAIELEELGELADAIHQRVRGEFPAIVTFPMVAAGDLYGVLAVLRTGPEMREADHGFAAAMADLAAIAVSKAVQFDELQRSLAELQASREALTRSEKLRAMGSMAAGIAHDLKNLLNPLSLQVQLLQRMCRKQPDPEVAEILTRMREAIRFGVEVVERMRTFSRQQPEAQAEKITLAQVAESAAEICRPRVRQLPGLELSLAVEPGPVVRVRSGELASAITNLVVNAADAIQNTADKRGHIWLRSGADESGAWVEVADDGPGMPPEVERRVFEPFFTTKPDGTGLGLAMVYAFVQRHGGRLDLETAPASGTRIRLSFPLAA